MKPGLGVTQGHRNEHTPIRHLSLPINIPLPTMGLSRTISEINGDFGRKSQFSPTPCILCRRWRVPLELGNGTGGPGLQKYIIIVLR